VIWDEKARRKGTLRSRILTVGLKVRFWNFLTVQTGCKIRQVK